MAVSKYELKAKKELRAIGYLIDWKIRPTRPTRGYTVDYFNAFDIMAYKKGEPIRFISIKGHANVPSAHRKLLESFVFGKGVQKEIWTYHIDRTVKKEILK